MKTLIYIFGFFILSIGCKNNRVRYLFKNDPSIIVQYENPTIKNKRARSYFNKGLNNIEKEKYKKARDYFKKAENNEKGNLTILTAIANVENTLGNSLKAIELYEFILKIDSNYINAYVNYGLTLNEHEEYEKSKKIMFKALSIETDNKLSKGILNYNLSKAFYGLKDYNNAISFAKRSKMYYPQQDLIDEIDYFIETIKSEMKEKDLDDL